MSELAARIEHLPPGPREYWQLQLALAERERRLLPGQAQAREQAIESALANAQGKPSETSDGPAERLRSLIEDDLKTVLTVSEWERLQHLQSQDGENRARSWQLLQEQRRRLDERLDLPDYRSVWTGLADPRAQELVWQILNHLLRLERARPHEVRGWRLKLAKLQKKGGNGLESGLTKLLASLPESEGDG